MLSPTDEALLAKVKVQAQPFLDSLSIHLEERLTSMAYLKIIDSLYVSFRRLGLPKPLPTFEGRIPHVLSIGCGHAHELPALRAYFANDIADLDRRFIEYDGVDLDEISKLGDIDSLSGPKPPVPYQLVQPASFHKMSVTQYLSSPLADRFHSTNLLILRHPVIGATHYRDADPGFQWFNMQIGLEVLIEGIAKKQNQRPFYIYVSCYQNFEMETFIALMRNLESQKKITVKEARFLESFTKKSEPVAAVRKGFSMKAIQYANRIVHEDYANCGLFSVTI